MEQPRYRIQILRINEHRNYDVRHQTECEQIEDFTGTLRQCQRFISKALKKHLPVEMRYRTHYEIVCYPNIKEI